MQSKLYDGGATATILEYFGPCHQKGLGRLDPIYICVCASPSTVTIALWQCNYRRQQVSESKQLLCVNCFTKTVQFFFKL